MKTILNLIALVSLTMLIYVCYVNWGIVGKFDIPIIDFSQSFTTGWILLIGAVLGVLFGFCYSIGLYRTQKIKAEAYYRELEKSSINNMTGDDKVKVLESKINVLEKALEEALKKKN